MKFFFSAPFRKKKYFQPEERKEKTMKKFLSLMLVALMVITMLPMSFC